MIIPSKDLLINPHVLMCLEHPSSGVALRFLKSWRTRSTPAIPPTKEQKPPRHAKASTEEVDPHKATKSFLPFLSVGSFSPCRIVLLPRAWDVLQDGEGRLPAGIVPGQSTCWAWAKAPEAGSRGFVGEGDFQGFKSRSHDMLSLRQLIRPASAETGRPLLWIRGIPPKKERQRER